jgi:outer membrane protein
VIADVPIIAAADAEIAPVIAPEMTPEMAGVNAAFQDGVKHAEALIADGAMDAAQVHLLALEEQRQDDNQVQFLLGLISFSRADYDGAIVRFRRILTKEPNAVRVRLELGRTYFEKRDLRNAERQFQFARSGQLPVAVLDKVDTYLATIRQQRSFEFGVSFAIAPDTNINAGPSVSDVLIYGLPFQLSADAKPSSGVGVAVGSRLKWTPRLSKRMRWDFGAAGDARRYGRQEFNDTAVSVFTGPRLILDRLDASLHARASRRWYGGQPYASGKGGSLDLTYYVSGRTGISYSLNIARLNYPRIPEQNGVLRESVMGAFHAITPSSRGQVSLSVARQDAKAPALANQIFGAEMGYLREIGGGFTFNLAARYRRTRYGAVWPAFGVVRNDDQFVGQLTVLNRRIVVRGFTPTLSFTQTRNNSNIPLFRFGRSQFEFGISRVF